MKVSLFAVAMVLVCGVFSAASAGDSVPRGTLSKLGLGNMQPMSDVEAMEVRGHAFPVVPLPTFPSIVLPSFPSVTLPGFPPIVLPSFPTTTLPSFP